MQQKCRTYNISVNLIQANWHVFNIYMILKGNMTAEGLRQFGFINRNASSNQ